MNSNLNLPRRIDASKLVTNLLRIDGLKRAWHPTEIACEIIDPEPLREGIQNVMAMEPELGKHGFTSRLMKHEAFLEERRYMESDEFLFEVARATAFVRKTVRPQLGIAWSRMDAEFAAQAAAGATAGKVGVGAMIVAALILDYDMGRREFCRTAWFNWYPGWLGCETYLTPDDDGGEPIAVALLDSDSKKATLGSVLKDIARGLDPALVDPDCPTRH